MRKDDKHKSKEKEDEYASRGEREGEVKESKRTEWKIFSKFNSSHGKRSPPSPSRITEDSVVKREDIWRFRAYVNSN